MTLHMTAVAKQTSKRLNLDKFTQNI